MRYLNLAIPFYVNYEPLNSQVQEFNIYVGRNNSVDRLVDFITMYSNVRINIEFIGQPDFKTAELVSRLSHRVFFKLTDEQLHHVAEFNKRGLKFYLNEKCAAYNVCSLKGLIDLGVTDVYLADDLWYKLPEISDLCLKRGVRIRLVLNRIPATYPMSGTDPKAPIFSPQDMPLLKQYIDVFEFDLGDPKEIHKEKLKVFYHRWFETEDWLGQLNELNEDVQMDWPCQSYLTGLTAVRIRCRRRCDSRATNPCRKCEQLLNISRTLRDEGYKFDYVTLEDGEEIDENNENENEIIGQEEEIISE